MYVHLTDNACMCSIPCSAASPCSSPLLSALRSRASASSPFPSQFCSFSKRDEIQLIMTCFMLRFVSAQAGFCVWAKFCYRLQNALYSAFHIIRRECIYWLPNSSVFSSVHCKILWSSISLWQSICTKHDSTRYHCRLPASERPA